jgi:uncharacterized protein YdeI (YjbR/CyaY-like superfamily)
MEQKDDIQSVGAGTRAEWRQWLEQNHQSQKAVWLIIYKKQSGIPSVYYPEAVDEALCFGWIDSKAIKRDAQSVYQYFARRNPKSNWSGVNKEKVTRLIAQGLMTAAGYQMIEIAKQTGTWTALDDVEQLQIPADLEALFRKNKAAYENWNQFPRSARRGILEWILNAKRPETRQKRIEETVALAAVNKKANQPRQ